MSEQQDPPPPKPKPGSLRDRIAAFEKKPDSSSPSPPPPRPKPGGVQWKPKPPPPISPPTSPQQSSSSNDKTEGGSPVEQRRAGMSAADAMESITRGGSLKERMAALQGRGAFGAPAPPTAPKPAVEKPRWKPPPVVSPPPADDDDAVAAAPGGSTAEEPKPKPTGDESGEQHAEPTGETEDTPAPDPEEEERQRRAAIAARMARLGGARVGMAPPVFGRKPDPPKKPQVLKAEEERPVQSPPKEDVAEEGVNAETPSRRGSVKSANVEDTASPPAQAPAESPEEEKSSLKTTSQTSLPLPDSGSPPTSMPAPAVPRRALPPRKKSSNPKSPPTATAAGQTPPLPAPAPVENKEGIVGEGGGDEGDVNGGAGAHATGGEGDDGEHAENKVEDVAKEPEPLDAPAGPAEESEPAEPEARNVESEGPEHTDTPATEDRAPEHEQEQEHEQTTADEEHPAEHEVREEQEEQEEEEDEQARRARIASRLAKSGGLNPFAMPMPPPPTVPHESESEAASAGAEPVQERKPSSRKASEDLQDGASPSPGHTQPVPASRSLPTPPSRKTSASSPPPPTSAFDERRTSGSGVSRKVSGDSYHGPPVRKGSVEGGIKMDEDEDKEPYPAEAGDEEEGREEREEEREEDTLDDHEEDTTGALPISIPEHEPIPIPVHAPVAVKPAAVPMNETESAPEDKDVDDTEIPHHLEEEEDDGSVYSARGEHDAENQERPQKSETDRHEYEYGDEDKDEETPSHEEYDGQSPGNDNDSALSHHQFGIGSLTRDPHGLQSPRGAGLDDEEHIYAPHHEAQEVEEPEHEEEDHMAPPRIKRSLPPMPGQVAPVSAPADVDVLSLPEENVSAHARVRRSMPPPPRGVPPPPPPLESESGFVEDDGTPPPPIRPARHSTLPPPPIPPNKPEQSETSPVYDPDEDEDESLGAPPIEQAPITESANKRLSRTIPGGPRTAHEQRAIPIPPPPVRNQSPPAKAPSLVYAPPTPTAPVPVKPPTPKIQDWDGAQRSQVENLSRRAPPPEPLPLEDEPVREILDEDDGDPIDPSYTPPSRVSPSPKPPTSAAAPRAEETQVTQRVAPEQPAEEVREEDKESARRRTIAERMAKLGGIKFGAPPPPMRPPPIQTPRDPEAGDGECDNPPDDAAAVPREEEQPMSAEDEEEEERARKERISAKLAGMGGMRIGMLPSFQPAQHPRMRSDESATSAKTLSPAPPPPIPPSSRPTMPPPPPPPPAVSESDYEDLSASVTGSDADAVRVEAEESEIEEVTYEEAEEERPPPIPNRGERPTRPSAPRAAPPPPPPEESPAASAHESGRRASMSPRPPVPATSSAQTARRQSSQYSSPTHRKASREASSGSTHTVPPPPPPPQHSDFVMVDEPAAIDAEEAPPPPVPSRFGRGPPSSRLPPAPSAAEKEESGSMSAQWTLPEIPSSSLGADMSSSGWSEDSTAYREEVHSSPQPPEPPTPSGKPTRPVSSQHQQQTSRDVQLNGDELLALWGRVGVHVGEAAVALHEKSKRALIGDGTFPGFVNAVISHVPQAAPATALQDGFSYGHLVYAQTGNTVQKRMSDIMPGDVIYLSEAKLKGHKGIHSYHQAVGVGGEPVFGVVCEFEMKKSKVKVYQANQHVGGQTVEMVSYRLEDLKSGNVKVFRVAEA